jgi:penicillin-binding protein 1A
VSVTELVGAYAPFANTGLASSPHVINRIRATDTNKILYVRKPDPAAQVIDPRYVAMMNSMMHETIAIGTAKKADIPGWFAAGKTGTSQDFRDAWFVGYTAHLVTGVWFGNDDNSPTKKATGGGLPVEVWTRFMKAAHENVPVANLPVTQPGDFLSNLFQSSVRGSGQQTAAQQVSPSDPAYNNGGGGGYGAAPTQPPPRPGSQQQPYSYPAYPPVTRTSARPEASSGLSGGGWLMDRLFGGR